MLHKRIFTLLMTVAIFLLAPQVVNACDFEFQIENRKESYRVGDEVIVNVTLKLTHRNCKVSPDETQFSGEGIEILGATKWIDVAYNQYSRKIKIKITGDASAHKLLALRECQKDGAKGNLIFKTS